MKHVTKCKCVICLQRASWLPSLLPQPTSQMGLPCLGSGEFSDLAGSTQGKIPVDRDGGSGRTSVTPQLIFSQATGAVIEISISKLERSEDIESRFNDQQGGGGARSCSRVDCENEALQAHTQCHKIWSVLIKTFSTSNPHLDADFPTTFIN